MDRRAFLSSFALGTLAVPHAAPAQPKCKVYRIGIPRFLWDDLRCSGR